MHTCVVCFKHFSDKNALETHLVIHSDGKLFTCDLCNKSFNEESTLKMHRLIHTAENLHTCDICQRSFDQKITLKMHYLTHPKPYKCFMCFKAFALESHLQNHFSSHSNQNSPLQYGSKCFPTIKETKSQKLTRKYEKVSHNLHEKNLKKDISKKLKKKHHPVKSKVFRCSICSQEFMEYVHLKAHFDLHSSDSDFFCGQCGVIFSEKRDYELHVKYHDDVTITFLCEFCKESFPTLEDLRKHETKHKTSNFVAGHVTFLCKFCNESFPTTEELKKHEIKHKTSNGLADITFLCEFCKESFPTVEELKKHEMKHKTSNGLVDITFLCEFCKESFPTVEELKKHKTCNSLADITFLSEFCKESFSSIEELEKHEIKHETLSDIADENTESISSLTDHPETESDDCVMMCEKCGDVFYSNCDFSSHLFLHKLSDEHSEENPDSRDNIRLCEKCGDVFDDKNNFMNHVSSHIKLCEKCGGIFDSEIFFTNHVPSHLCHNSSDD